MPRIGLRNVKTACSVGICLLIYFIIVIIASFYFHEVSRGIKLASTIYTPFFACIASAYAVSTDKGKSISQAKLRCLASIVGGLLGVLIIVIYRYGFNNDWPFSHINALGDPAQGFTKDDFTISYLLSFTIPLILTALGTVLVIWVCNLIKHPELSFVAVLTFTAVMVSFGTNPIIYGPNRILSTTVGVLVALGVNLCRLPRFKDQNKVLIVSLDGFLENGSLALSGYNLYKLNHLYSDKAKLVYYSNRTPEGLILELNGLKTDYPIITMSGAALYDLKKKEYLYTLTFEPNLANEVLAFLNQQKLNPFVSFVEDNVLYTYVEKLINQAEVEFFKARKDSAYGCLVKGYVYAKDYLFFMVLAKEEQINNALSQLNDLGFLEELEPAIFSAKEIIGTDLDKYLCLKLYPKQITKLDCLSYFKDNIKVGLGIHELDLNLLSKMDFKVTNLNNNANNMKMLKNNEQLIKELGKYYYQRNEEAKCKN